MTVKLKPFQNENEAIVIGDELNFENGKKAIRMWGEIEITNDAEGFHTVVGIIKVLQVIQETLAKGGPAKNQSSE